MRKKGFKSLFRRRLCLISALLQGRAKKMVIEKKKSKININCCVRVQMSSKDQEPLTHTHAHTKDLFGKDSSASVLPLAEECFGEILEVVRVFPPETLISSHLSSTATRRRFHPSLFLGDTDFGFGGHHPRTEPLLLVLSSSALRKSFSSRSKSFMPSSLGQ